MTSDLRLDGSRIRDIASLYAELNRMLMPDEDWTLGESLDALDDLLYGGYGALAARDPESARTRIVWDDHDRSREALGLAATRAWYLGKLARPEIYAAAGARASLDALEAGTGPTYFELVVQVFADHPDLELVLA